MPSNLFNILYLKDKNLSTHKLLMQNNSSLYKAHSENPSFFTSNNKILLD